MGDPQKIGYPGGAAAPKSALLGSTVQFPGYTPNYLALDGQEFLKQGSIVPYSAAYAPLIASNPFLGVYGNDAAQKGGATTSSVSGGIRYHYIGTKYVATQANVNLIYSSDLATWTGCTGGITPAQGHRTSAGNGSYIVVSPAAANTALSYTADGVTFAAVGGTFTTHPTKTAVAFGNNIWVALSTLNGTAGEQSYIAAANPSGAWTVGASTNVSMTSVFAIAYGAGVFVAVGHNSGLNSCVLATCTTPAGGWTDRTSTVGTALGLVVGESIGDVIFDGSRFWLMTSIGKLAKSSDGINWTLVTNCPIAVYAATNTASGLGTDGGGRIVVSQRPFAAGVDLMWASTSDGGVTWTAGAIYVGKAPATAQNYGTMNYANGKWLECHTANGQNPLDLGTLTGAPNYVGGQYPWVISPTNNIPAHIRIK